VQAENKVLMTPLQNSPASRRGRRPGAAQRGASAGAGKAAGSAGARPWLRNY